MVIKNNNDKRNFIFPVTENKSPFGGISGNPSKGTFLPIGAATENARQSTRLLLLRDFSRQGICQPTRVLRVANTHGARHLEQSG